VKWRRALVVLASAGGNDVAVIAGMVQTSPDRVREMIHRFNEKGMRSLDPAWAGGRPRRIQTTERELIVTSAQARPGSLGQPFTRWSLRKLQHYLATKRGTRVQVSTERLRQILSEEHITFQSTKTWKESPDPHREEKLARIEEVLEHHRDRVFSFDEFGPLAIKPERGHAWAPRSCPQRLRANYHKPHGTRQLFAWYSVGDDRLFGRIERRKGAAPTLRALQAIRALRPDGGPVYVILDNLNHHRGLDLRTWCLDHAVELCFTPTYASWANPIEAHFGPLREFVIANSDYPDHPSLTKALRAYLSWRNAHTKDPELLALERKRRAEIRGEAQRRWGQPKRPAA
jgi:transposase